MHQILSGIRVLELGQLIAGPFAAKTLADFGAEIIKVESPQEGDPLRKWRMIHEGTSVWWQAQSRNKQSICIDLRVKEGQDIVRRLAKEADVLIENFRPGTMEKWGMGWDELPRLQKQQLGFATSQDILARYQREPVYLWAIRLQACMAPLASC
jgi:formyl-CoA transferase